MKQFLWRIFMIILLITWPIIALVLVVVDGLIAMWKSKGTWWETKEMYRSIWLSFKKGSRL